MRRPLLGLLSLSLAALPLVSCGGGGGPPTLGAVCNGNGSLCIVSCNLGCSLVNGCSVTQIAVNQPLIFRFSQPIDAASVGPSSFSLKSPRGAEPLGDFFVQGNEVRFIPAVFVQNGQNVYGFTADETYRLEIHGGPDAASVIKSVSGDRLPSTLRCDLTANLGVVDIDGKPPAAELIVPSTSTNVPAGTLIVLEFSEVLNTTTFRNGGTGGGIFYKVALPDPRTPGQCLLGIKDEFPLPGTVSLSIDQIKNRTRVVFRPALLLPGEACVRVQVTPQIRDLAGNGAKPKLFEFKIEKRNITDQFEAEDFSSKAKVDRKRTGASWGNGYLKTGKLGSSGILGEFLATDGTPKGKDSKGRDIYEWSTDNQTIPDIRTLSGKDEVVKDGVFEFLTFVVRDTDHIRFVGKNIPRIKVAGLIQIDGVIELPVPRPPTSNLNTTKGLEGGLGGPGGAKGGQGGDDPAASSAVFNGRPGGAVVLPAGHPRASQAVGTGGFGATAWPTSGKNKDLVWIIESSFKVMVRMVAAGGGGGSMWDPGGGSLLGTGGRTEKAVSKPPFWPFQPGEFSGPSKGGKQFPVLPGVSTKKSTDMFLIGGSGGGGGGAHPLYTADEQNIKWSPAGGGAGGGGAILLQAGSDVLVSDKAEVIVRGGNSNNQNDGGKQPPARAPGGAGSGGSVLIQSGGLPQILGSIDVRGGTGGTLAESDPALLYIRSIGGNGGAGYVRVESDPAPKHTNFPRFKPTATAGNVGLLRSIDGSKQTVGASLWYVTRTLFPPQYLRYVIKAKVEGKPVTFSDDPAKVPGSRKATLSEPVAIYLQSAAVDAKTAEPIGRLTPWKLADATLLNSEDNKGNGFRWMILLNRGKTPTGNGEIEIDSITVFYRG